ncbi:MAG: NADH-quinone oxidoreductase subunit NuoK [Ardenticatenaceae bacterium]|nr:NADH-quinone oxidoreductase subunit NuoK [Ardenticatenaceae bacterium]MCB9445136.1 NADH-quinone oxidoreductase subunit NuoK [Ardenticatenaceae bacterium]
MPLSWYLLVAAALFAIGLYGVMARRNAVAILMGVELMLNAVNINLVAFWRYRSLVSEGSAGLAWAVFVLTVAAAEAAVGLALVISIYRSRDSVVAEDLDILKN